MFIWAQKLKKFKSLIEICEFLKSHRGCNCLGVLRKHLGDLGNKNIEVGCKGGSRYVEGQGASWFLGFLVPWFLGSLVSQFLGFVVSWFIGFLVSWFLGFRVSWLLGSRVACYKVSWFLGFKVSKICQMPISCFLEDIDPISKIVKNLFDGSLGFVGPRLFHNFQNIDFETMLF